MKKIFLLVSVFILLLGGVNIFNVKHPFVDVKSFAIQSKERMVVFNTKSKKVHKPSCHWAQKCTKSCENIPASAAYKRGGVACKKCGG